MTAAASDEVVPDEDAAGAQTVVSLKAADVPAVFAAAPDDAAGDADAAKGAVKGAGRVDEAAVIADTAKDGAADFEGPPGF